MQNHFSNRHGASRLRLLGRAICSYMTVKILNSTCTHCKMCLLRKGQSKSYSFLGKGLDKTPSPRRTELMDWPLLKSEPSSTGPSFHMNGKLGAEDIQLQISDRRTVSSTDFTS